MHLFTRAFCATVAVGLLAGCSGSNLPAASSSAPVGMEANHLVNGHFVPEWSKLANLIPMELQPGPQRVLDRIVPDKHKGTGVVGIYGSQFYAAKTNGYKGGDPKNAPPVCSLSASYLNDISTDAKGDLIEPDGGTRTIIVYKGPKLCGPSLGTISDPYGQPSDAASLNAATGIIIVGGIFGTSGAGGIAICTLARGCYKFLKNPAMYEVAGVALAKNGDCWDSGSTSAGVASLIYFKHCSGSGKAATGFKNTYYGGLDIDAEGNIVAIDSFTPQLWIYSGCNPRCKVVGGPFPFHGDSVYGHLNGPGTELIAGDYALGALDVYKYSTKALTYQYSINNGLDVSDDVEGAAFDPHSKE
ncbi:MAG: hypothetical protein WBW76_17150 [Candidatus Cybelea sp.]